MENLNLLEEIKKRMPIFSKSQKRIGSFMIDHYEKAAYMTASKLGLAVDVSESTVVRFAIEMGFEGYPEMQKALQAYGKTRLTALQRLDVTNDRIGERNLLKSMLTQDIERIRSTIEITSEENFDKAVSRIIEARKIYIFGAMSSNILARFMDNYFQLIFDNVQFIQPINTSGIFQQMLRISDKDVFIVISFPRYSKNATEAADYAKKSGADIIAITDTESSPLAPLADQLLLAKSDMASFADSLVAPLSLINAIIAAVGLRNREQLEQTLQKLEDMWDANDVYNKEI